MASKDWQRLNFTLTPSAGDQAGRFVLALKQPGSLMLGHAFLQPGDWGRFKGLPVRRDVAEGLIDQGVTVLRYGGSMVNNDGYRWKKMIGQRDRRPPYAGTWYRYSTNGWGIADFMDFCEAAGFEYIPDFNIDETPKDMADFIEYAKGPARANGVESESPMDANSPISCTTWKSATKNEWMKSTLPNSSLSQKQFGQRTPRSCLWWATSPTIVESKIRSKSLVPRRASPVWPDKSAFCNWPASTTAKFGLTYMCGRIGR